MNDKTLNRIGLPTRTDIEPITGMRFKRVEDTDAVKNAWLRMNEDSGHITAGQPTPEEDKLLLMMMDMEKFDPYRLGTLTLNEESEYNKGMKIIPTKPTTAKPNRNPVFGKPMDLGA